MKAKHGYLKDLSKKLKNYKSVCTTLAFRHQQDMLFKWNDCNIFEPFPFLKKCNVTTIRNNTYSDVISQFLNSKSDTRICMYIWEFCHYLETKFKLIILYVLLFMRTCLVSLK